MGAVCIIFIPSSHKHEPNKATEQKPWRKNVLHGKNAGTKIEQNTNMRFFNLTAEKNW